MLSAGIQALFEEKPPSQTVVQSVQDDCLHACTLALERFASPKETALDRMDAAIVSEWLYE